MQNAPRDGSWLKVGESVRDFDAEVRRSERIEAAKQEFARIAKSVSYTEQVRMIRDGEMPVIENEKEPIFKRIERQFMHVEGRAFLTTKVTDLLSMMTAQAGILEAIQQAFEGRESSSISNAEITKVMKRVEGTKQDLAKKMDAFGKCGVSSAMTI